MIKESEHYLFHFEKGTLIERNIDSIISGQEACFNHICNALKGTMNHKINYYLCNTAEDVGRIYEDKEPCNAFASVPNKIYAVYNENVKCVGYHEDVHLISYSIYGKPKSSFIREGLAMYFDKTWWGINNLTWVKCYLTQNQIPSVIELFENQKFYQYKDHLSYPVAGVFTAYLIERFGMDAYFSFYKQEDFKKAYNTPISIIHEDFFQYMNNISINPSIFNLITEELNKSR